MGLGEAAVELRGRVNTFLGLAVVAATSAAGTFLARAYALRRRLVDEPGHRRAHTVATPRGGGAGPVVAILAWLLAGHHTAGAATWPVALALAAVAVIGMWDDHTSIPASRRLVVHVLAGFAVADALVDPQAHPFALVGIAGLVAVLINVWNFMDGINGIAASQAVIVAAAIACLASAYGAAAIVVAVASLAFLPFNFPRARIFLGDVGSGALGLAIAWLGAGVAAEMDFRAEALMLTLPLSAFLVDAGLTLSRRMLRRERWWEPHSQHLYQGLARRFGHVPVTLAYASWTLLASIVMLAAKGRAQPFTMASVALCYTTAALLWFALQHRVVAGCVASDTRDP
jgi:UDP-N-acetylmuramyl pentapeptide phosphotransferase/UDP-N-acetylglucosamine-1-phosphate transferase